MDNKLGFAGAYLMACHRVMNQWTADKKYSILQMDYGLSIKNHANDEYPIEDLCEIAKFCLGLENFKFKVEKGICRVYPQEYQLDNEKDAE